MTDMSMVMTMFQIFIIYMSNCFKSFGTSACIYILDKYCQIIHCLRERGNKIYNSNEIVKNVCNNISYFFYAFCSLLLNKNFEPMDNNWTCVSVLYSHYYNKPEFSIVFENDAFKHQFNEYYVYLKDVTMTPYDAFKKSFNIAYDYIDNKDVNECLITMRMSDIYIYRVCDKKKENKLNLELKRHCETPELSKVKFITIEIILPKYSNPIFIDIPKNAYVIGNELLSSSFIKRFLEQKNRALLFDMNYSVRILDNNIKVFLLHSNEYIVLDKFGYNIVKK